MCGDSATENTNVAGGRDCLDENTEGENGGGRGGTISRLKQSLIEGKNERNRERNDKLDKALSKFSVPPRSQPPRNSAVVPAVDVMDDFDISSDESEDSDLDSVGSNASYDPTQDLRNNTDSDWTDGLQGEDKISYHKTVRRKKRFLYKPRDTPVPILQRCEPNDRSSQKCKIVRRQQDGEGGRERERDAVVLAGALKMLL